MSRWTCRSITKYACLDCGYYDKEEEKMNFNYLAVVRYCKNCPHDESHHEFDFESSWCEYGWWLSSLKKCNCKGFEEKKWIIKGDNNTGGWLEKK